MVVVTRARKGGKLKSGLVALAEEESRVEIKGKEDSLTEAILSSSFRYDPIAHCLAYKKVADKVRPVPGTMPSDIRIIRKFPEDPLKTIPWLSPLSPTIFARNLFDTGMDGCSWTVFE